MVLDGLEVACGKVWSDGETQLNGWGESRGGGAITCGGPAWEGEGLSQETGLDPGTETLKKRGGERRATRGCFDPTSL